jgi:hypothetical protein
MTDEGEVMKRSHLLTVAVLSAASLLVGEAFATSVTRPISPFAICYQFNNYVTDALMLDMHIGDVVTGRYRQYVQGASPGSGSVDALMVGTIQQVPVGNEVPPYNQRTQIALSGSMATGNFAGTPKAWQCWLHLVFEDAKMATGRALGACTWFDGELASYGTSDMIDEPIHRINCRDFPYFSAP